MVCILISMCYELWAFPFATSAMTVYKSRVVAQGQQHLVRLKNSQDT